MPQERDWDKEMREVDKLLSKLPNKPDEPQRQAGGAKAAAAPATPAPAGSTWLGAWMRVGLGVVFGVAMTQWPYAHACGWPLAFYCIGVAATIVWGTWGLFLSWRRRLGFAHTLSIGVLVTGIVLAASTIAQRVGDQAAAQWFCPGP